FHVTGVQTCGLPIYHFDDLDPVAGLEARVRPCRARHHGVVQRYRDAPRPRIDPLGDQGVERGPLQRHRLAVDDDLLAHAVLLSGMRSAAPAAGTAKRSIVKSRTIWGTRPPSIASLTACAVSGVSRWPLRWCPVARNSPSTAVGPRIGASSRLVGRKPVHSSSIGSSSIAGTTRHAASSRASTPP